MHASLACQPLHLPAGPLTFNQAQLTLLADTLLCNTQETVIAGSGADAAHSELDLLGGGMGGGSAEMRFHLPASPSCGVLQFLMGGCQEVKRAGDHRIGEEGGGVCWS